VYPLFDPVVLTVAVAKTRATPAARIVWFYAVGTLSFFAVKRFGLPLKCVWKTAFGWPCPGCGLTRAFSELCAFNFVGAEKFNIISVPLAVGLLVVFICTVAEIVFKLPALSWLKSIASRKLFIGLVILLALASWAYNIINGI
jgi:hypothetical protein